MIKKIVNITDPMTGTERKVECYFHLTQGELAEMQIATEGGLTEVLQAIVDSKNSHLTVQFFRAIILKAHGEKTEDGEFWKNIKRTEIFAAGPAYSAIICWLLQCEPAEMKKFMEGVMAPGLVTMG
jgi:hypothetical protein